MKKIVTTCFLSLLVMACSYAQQGKIKYSKLFESYYISYWTYSFGLGTVAYRGDLCGRPECNTFKPVVSLGLNYKAMPHIAVGTEFNYFQLQAIAGHSSNENLKEFRSTNYDIKLYARYYYFEDNYRTANDKIALKRFNPYGQLGVSMVYYSPVASVINPVDYHPPVQTMSYPAYSFGLPVSLGFSYSFSRRVSLLAEGVYNATFTDYLDGQASNVENTNGRNDSYIMALVKLQWNPSAPSDKKKKAKNIVGNDLKPKTKEKNISSKTKKTKTPKEKKSKAKKTKASKSKTKTKIQRSPAKGANRKVDRHPTK